MRMTNMNYSIFYQNSQEGIPTLIVYQINNNRIPSIEHVITGQRAKDLLDELTNNIRREDNDQTN